MQGRRSGASSHAASTSNIEGAPVINAVRSYLGKPAAALPIPFPLYRALPLEARVTAGRADRIDGVGCDDGLAHAPRGTLQPSAARSSPLLSFPSKSGRMISDIDLAQEDAMRIAGLAIVAFLVTGSVVPAVAVKAQSLCRPDLTASFGSPLDTFAEAPKVRGRVAARCPSPARRRGELPTCNSGPSITCRGTCSGGAEWFSWQCCIGPDGFPPVCSLNCNKEFAGCLAQ
jgi:hypothetical protein